MSTSHTPGPWVAFYKHKYDEWHVSLPVEGSSMLLGIFPDGLRSENRAADARLIAAAPELLAELKIAIGHIEHMAAFFGGKGLGYSFESLGEDMPRIRAALAKAEAA